MPLFSGNFVAKFMTVEFHAKTSNLKSVLQSCTNLILLTFGHGEFIANDNNLWSDLFQNEKYVFMWSNTKNGP